MAALAMMGASAVATLLAATLPGGLAAADSFTPVTLTISVAPVARLHAPLAVKVAVAADAGALDDRSGPVRVQVKLASECGGTYQYTPGAVLLNKQLSPQPSTGRPYTASVRGSGKPSAYGTQTVCVWLNDADSRTWASDQSTQVDVSRSCTSAAARYDTARKRHRKRKTIAADRRAASKACGPGVPL